MGNKNENKENEDEEELEEVEKEESPKEDKNKNKLAEIKLKEYNFSFLNEESGLKMILTDQLYKNYKDRTGIPQTFSLNFI